ncbi:MAG: hypothetical protein JW797_04850 [Bradymonadales bacterium]|nr:hypothetical protein [Bradymonadales bacterium]
MSCRGLVHLAVLVTFLVGSCAQTTTGEEPDAGVEEDGGDLSPLDTTTDPLLDPIEEEPEDLLSDQAIRPDGEGTDQADALVDQPSDLEDATSDATADFAGDPAEEQEELPPYPQPVMEGFVAGVDDSFWANMDDLIFEVLQDGPVQLYLTILSSNFYNNQPYRAWGMELLRQPESFFANAVIPLLERYGDSGTLWAIDCLNEPEALVAGPQGNWEDWGLSWEEMRAYLAYCADMVHLHSDLLVSAGSGWHNQINVASGLFSGLGFDFLDYHHYSDSPSIPSVSSLNVDLPVVIGEFGQLSDNWDDALQLAVARQYFSQAEQGGYLAALSWYYNHAGSTNQLSHLNADGSWRPIEQAFAEYADGDLITGTNLAWFSGAYDHDMGINPLHPTWGVAYDHEVAAEVAADLAAHDIGVLRFWIFEGGEALITHQLFADFENGSAPFAPTTEGVTIRSSAMHPADGSSSLALHFDPDKAGWYGIKATWDQQTPLNLNIADEWSFSAFNGLDTAVGINLAFVTRSGELSTTYQTRSGPQGGQLWLAAGGSGSKIVILQADGFEQQWALDTAPTQGVARPSDEVLSQVVEIQVRVYLSDTQLDVSGDLYLDAVRIR